MTGSHPPQQGWLVSGCWRGVISRHPYHSPGGLRPPRCTDEGAKAQGSKAITPRSQGWDRVQACPPTTQAPLMTGSREAGGPAGGSRASGPRRQALSGAQQSRVLARSLPGAWGRTCPPRGRMVKWPARLRNSRSSCCPHPPHSRVTTPQGCSGIPEELGLAPSSGIPNSLHRPPSKNSNDRDVSDTAICHGANKPRVPPQAKAEEAVGQSLGGMCPLLKILFSSSQDLENCSVQVSWKRACASRRCWRPRMRAPHHWWTAGSGRHSAAEAT